MTGPERERWNIICNRAYAMEDSVEIIQEFKRRMEPYKGMHINLTGGPTPERYDLCSSVMLEILEPVVSLRVQADEYEEALRALELMETF